MWRILFALVLLSTPADAQFLYPLGLKPQAGGGGGGGYTGPVVSGSPVVSFFGGSSGSFDFTTTAPNSDIFIVVYSETPPGGVLAQVLSVTNIGPSPLTWSKLNPPGAGHAAQVSDNAVITANRSNLEIWWARAASAATYTTITIGLTGGVDGSVFVAFAATNANATNPQDANASIAASAAGASSPNPSVTGISTTATNSLLISAVGTASPTIDCPGIASSPVPAGYTEIGHYDFPGGFPANYACVSVAYKQVSAAQSGVSATWTNSSTWPNWVSLVTALVP